MFDESKEALDVYKLERDLNGVYAFPFHTDVGEMI